VQVPTNIRIKVYTEIIYATCKRNVPTIRRKKRQRWSNSMRKVFCPNLVFIDVYALALTTDQHWISSTLEFSNNTILFASVAYRQECALKFLTIQNTRTQIMAKCCVPVFLFRTIFLIGIRSELLLFFFSYSRRKAMISYWCLFGIVHTCNTVALS
jgi:hypothetical protein